MSPFPAAVQTSLGRTLRLGKQLGKGGEGAVFASQENPDIALKLYWPKKAAERSDKVRTMVSAGWHKTNSFVAFPMETLFAPGGLFLGFAMRKMTGFKPIHLLYSPASRKVEFSNINFHFLTRAAINACKAVASVHATGCVIGDVNHSGFLVSDKATITLIDSDSFQVNALNKSFFCKVGTPEYTPPELQGQRFDRTARNADHDNFGLAILIFQLLFMGRHPYSGRYRGKGEMPLERSIAEHRFAYSAVTSSTQMEPPPNAPLLADFPDYVGQAFEQAFSRSPAKRPNAQEWIGLLNRAESDLQKCAADQAHHHFKTKACPWCRMERATPGFFAFVTGQTIQTIQPLIVDISKIITLLRTIPDPGPTPDILAVVRNPGINKMPSSVGSVKFPAIPYRHLAGLLTAFAGVVSLLSAQTLLGVVLLAAGSYFVFKTSSASNPTGDALKQAQLVWNGITTTWSRQTGNSRFLDLRREIDSAIDALNKIPDDERRGILQLERQKKEIQLTQYLERFRISNHKIRKIGSGRKAVLASYGIETAADIQTNRLSQIQGFGPSLVGELISWRGSLERNFIYKPGQPLNPIDVARVKSLILKRKTDLETKIKSSATELLRTSTTINTQRKSLTIAAQRAYDQLKQCEYAHRNEGGSETKFAKYIIYGCLFAAYLIITNPPKSSPPPRPQSKTIATDMAKRSDLKNADLLKNDKKGSLQYPQKSSNEATVNKDRIEASNSKQREIAQSYNTPLNGTDLGKAKTPEAEKPLSGLILLDRHVIPPVSENTLPPLNSEHIGQEGQKNSSEQKNNQDIPVVLPKMSLSIRDDVVLIQERLIELGYLDEAATGKWDSKSQKALREFRVVNEIGASENWNSETENLIMESAPIRNPNTTFFGAWSPKRGSCSNSDLVPLKINRELAESASGKCNFKQVERLGAMSWRIRAECSVQNSTWTSNIALTRTGDRLFWSSQRGTAIYYLCPG